MKTTTTFKQTTVKNRPPHKQRGRQSGVVLLEVLITILVFAIGMLGVFAMQIASKRTNFEATQRSEAALLANDIISRIQNSGATPTEIAAYYFTPFAVSNRVILSSSSNLADFLSVPESEYEKCATTECTLQELARYDLANWQKVIKGAAVTTTANTNVPGLTDAIGCLHVDTTNKIIQVSIAWSAMGTVKRTGEATALINYDSECAHPDLSDSTLPGNAANHVRQLVVRTYL